MKKLLLMFVSILFFAVSCNTTPASALDLTNETSYTVSNPMGTFKVTLSTPKQFTCPTTAEDFGYNCTFDIRTQVRSSTPIAQNKTVFFQGAVLDSVGAVLGVWTSYFRTPSAYSPGWGSTYMRGHADFNKTASGQIFLSGKSDDPTWSAEVTNERKSPISVQILDDDAYTQFMAANEAAIIDKLAKRVQTITCTKGKTARTAKGDPALCPTGYTNKLASNKSFKTFSSCKLYKKGGVHSSVSLSKSGSDINLRIYDYSSFNLDDFVGSSLEVTKPDYACIMKNFGVSVSIDYNLSQACKTKTSGSFRVDSKSRIEYSCDPRLGQTMTFKSY